MNQSCDRRELYADNERYITKDATDKEIRLKWISTRSGTAHFIFSVEQLSALIPTATARHESTSEVCHAFLPKLEMTDKVTLTPNFIAN